MHLSAYHQFLRVKRYLKKVRLIATKQFPEGVDDHVEDEVYAFFLNCHHLKDWVSKDSSLGIGQEKVTKFIESETCLTICADLANAHKHRGLAANKRSRKKPLPKEMPDFIYPICVHINQRIKPVTLGLEAKIKSDYGEYDYLDLAEECVKAWEIFLRASKAPDAFFQDH